MSTVQGVRDPSRYRRPFDVAPLEERRSVSSTPRHRLLIVSSHFPPDRTVGTHRVLRFANHFQAQGWSTFVLTLDPAAYRQSVPVDVDLCSRTDPALTIERTGAVRGLTTLLRWRNALTGIKTHGTDVSRVGAAGTEANPRGVHRLARVVANCFTFPDEEVGWFLPAVTQGLKLVRRQSIDLVLSSAPPFTSHLVANALKSLSKVKWIADCRDPWSRNPWGRRDSLFAHRWLEEQTVGRADAVILNTPELLDEFSEWYGPAIAKKFHVVTNGYDPDILRPYASLEPNHDPPLVLTHAGALYAQRNPLPLLEALAKCIHDGRIPRGSVRLQLIGKSVGRFDIAATIQRLDLSDTVVQIPPVGHATCLEMLAASHVLVAIQPGSSLQVPAKLYEYVGLRRPILALADGGAVARVIREARCGVVVSPRDVDAIAAALVDLYLRRSTLHRSGLDDSVASRFDARLQSGLLERIASQLMTGK
jgi:glycosyltransferase involved in cell wall biosynthesis